MRATAQRCEAHSRSSSPRLARNYGQQAVYFKSPAGKDRQSEKLGKPRGEGSSAQQPTCYARATGSASTSRAATSHFGTGTQTRARPGARSGASHRSPERLARQVPPLAGRSSDRARPVRSGLRPSVPIHSYFTYPMAKRQHNGAWMLARLTASGHHIQNVWLQHRAREHTDAEKTWKQQHQQQ